VKGNVVVNHRLEDVDDIWSSSHDLITAVILQFVDASNCTSVHRLVTSQSETQLAIGKLFAMPISVATPARSTASTIATATIRTTHFVSTVGNALDIEFGPK